MTERSAAAPLDRRSAPPRTRCRRDPSRTKTSAAVNPRDDGRARSNRRPVRATASAPGPREGPAGRPSVSADMGHGPAGRLGRPGGPSERPTGRAFRTAAQQSARPGAALCQQAQAIARLAKAGCRLQKSFAIRRRRCGSRARRPPFFEAVVRLPQPLRRMPRPMCGALEASGDFRDRCTLCQRRSARRRPRGGRAHYPAAVRAGPVAGGRG